MSTHLSTSTAAVKSMRWIARIISIPWAYWALFITFFLTVNLCPRNPSMWAILIPVLIIAFVMYVGAAIVASVWGKEVLGGRVLIADGVVLFVLGITFQFVAGGVDAIFKLDSIGVMGLLTIVFPPLVAGALFLACHKKSNP